MVVHEFWSWARTSVVFMWKIPYVGSVIVAGKRNKRPTWIESRRNYEASLSTCMYVFCLSNTGRKACCVVSNPGLFTTPIVSVVYKEIVWIGFGWEWCPSSEESKIKTHSCQNSPWEAVSLDKLKVRQGYSNRHRFCLFGQRIAKTFLITCKMEMKDWPYRWFRCEVHVLGISVSTWIWGF